MRHNVSQGITVLRHAARFLEQEAIPTKLGSIARHVAALSDLVDRLEALAAEQVYSHNGYRESAGKARMQVRALVREYARPVACQGKLMSAVDSELRVALKLPSGSVSYQEALVSLSVFADNVEARKAIFVEAGFDDTFVEAIRGAIAELEKSLTATAAYYGRRVRATEGLKLEFARGREMMRKLDAMVSPALSDDPRLASWRSLSRFARGRRREETNEQEVNSSGSGATPPGAVAGNGTSSNGEEHAA